MDLDEDAHTATPPAATPIVGLRPFSQAALNAQIDKVLDGLDPKVKMAMGVYGDVEIDPETGKPRVVGKVVWALRQKNGWSGMLEFNATKDPNKKVYVGGQFAVRKTWEG